MKAAISGGGGSASGGLGGLGLPAWPKVDFAKYGPIELQARTRIQKISAPGLARNWVMIPHVTQFDEADITELEFFRASINEENAKAGVKVSPLAFLMKAVVAALKKYPTVNSSLDGDNLVLKHYWHIGFAADTPQGLVVPVIKDVDKKGILEIAKETSELAAKARDGKLGPNDITGSTFTISSLGGIGGTAFTPIINAPEVAILGVSRSAVKPVWNGKEFLPRTMLPLSLSYDHRVDRRRAGRPFHHPPRAGDRRHPPGHAVGHGHPRDSGSVHRGLQEHPCHRDFGEAGRRRRQGHAAGDAGVGQGDRRGAFAGAGDGQGAEGQAGGPGLPGVGAADAGDGGRRPLGRAGRRERREGRQQGGEGGAGGPPAEQKPRHCPG